MTGQQCPGGLALQRWRGHHSHTGTGVAHWQREWTWPWRSAASNSPRYGTPWLEGHGHPPTPWLLGLWDWLWDLCPHESTLNHDHTRFGRHPSQPNETFLDPASPKVRHKETQPTMATSIPQPTDAAFSAIPWKLVSSTHSPPHPTFHLDEIKDKHVVITHPTQDPKMRDDSPQATSKKGVGPPAITSKMNVNTTSDESLITTEAHQGQEYIKFICRSKSGDLQ